MAADPNELFPPLFTPRLHLRALQLADTAFVLRHFSDPLVTAHLLDEPPLANEAEAQALIQFYLDGVGQPHNRWVIVRLADQQPIGTCGFHKWDRRNQRAEIGYDLGAPFWGQGYMTEALRAVLELGFTQLGLHRIEALVAVENTRSCRLLQTLGFQQEGRLRDYYCLNGMFYDHYHFALLAGEWVIR